jgi:uncharacterized surface protein with fasciclin (FAS1) repeats
MKSKRVITVMSVLLLGLILAAGPAWGRKPGPTIVEVVIDLNNSGDFAGMFDTLIEAVLAADPIVADTLTGNGQFTVFGPTDDAFADIGQDPNTIGDLDQETLTDILLYHVARGRRYSEDVLDSEKIRMLNREFLLQEEGTLTDNLGREADIIVIDVEAANGVIHAINRVVLPKVP